MKYWLLTTEYPPFFGGGIGTYSYQTGKMLTQEGYRVSIFINDPGVAGTREEVIDGVRVIRFNTNATGSAGFLGHTTNISYEFAEVLRTYILKEGKPDIIEAQEYLGIAYYFLQFKLMGYEWCTGIPVLITMHSPSFLYMEYNQISMYRYPNYLICEMERYCLQAADHIISPSVYMVSELRKRFTLTHERISVIPNPYRGPEISIENGQDTITEDQIVFFGKLTVQKGAFKLLQYFKTLWTSGFERPLYLIGGQNIVYHPEGITMGDKIRRDYREFILSQKLILEKGMHPDTIKTRLAKAEVVIIPSNNDNLPYVVIEMMALGKIVLVSRQGGQSEIVEDGTDGYIFDHSIPGDFANKLLAILNLEIDEKRGIAKNAKLKIATLYNYNWIFTQKNTLLKRLCSVKGDRTAVDFPFVRPLEAGHSYTVSFPSLKPDGLLSVVIPFFNMGKYINEAVNSVKASEYKNIEIIIVNDGSTEMESLVRLNTLRDQSDIKVIDTCNNGLANARNIGAELSSGEYLAFLDADDMVHPGYYSRAVKILYQYRNVDFIGCWTEYFENSTRKWPAFIPEPPMILYHNLVNSSALVYKKQSFLTSGKNDPEMPFTGLEDYDSVISMISQNKGGLIIPEVLFKYRVRHESMFRNLSREKKILLHQYIANKHRSFYSRYANELIGFLNANGPGILMDNPSLDFHLEDKLPWKGPLAKRVVSIIKGNKYASSAAYKLYRFLKK